MAQLRPYTVNAYNTAKDAENKIHDDAVARRFGFRGGLVPGVDVYGYMTHPAVQRWGRAWLECGSAECRFLKPVYDGEDAVVTAVEEADGIDIQVESGGELCAAGRASLPNEAPAPPPLENFACATPPSARPQADESSLAPGTPLGIRPLRVTPDFAAQYLCDSRETHALYAAEGIVHPGLILRTCNWALTHNVVLGPWVHVGSKIQHFSTAAIGDQLSVRARVAANYERKGHRFVELDAAAVTNERTVVARIAHTAIYRLRDPVN